jgi:hypothetical protein
MYHLSVVRNSRFPAEREMYLQPCGWVEVDDGPTVQREVGWCDLRSEMARCTGHHKAEILSTLANLFLLEIALTKLVSIIYAYSTIRSYSTSLILHLSIVDINCFRTHNSCQFFQNFAPRITNQCLRVERTSRPGNTSPSLIKPHNDTSGYSRKL